MVNNPSMVFFLKGVYTVSPSLSADILEGLSRPKPWTLYRRALMLALNFLG